MMKSELSFKMSLEAAKSGFKRLHAPHHDLCIRTMTGLPFCFDNSRAASNVCHDISVQESKYDEGCTNVHR